MRIKNKNGIRILDAKEKSKLRLYRADNPKALRKPICHICGYTIPQGIVSESHPFFGTIDHVIPLSRGGSNTPDNRLPAHRLCNRKKKDLELTQLLRDQCKSSVEMTLKFLNSKRKPNAQT